MVGLVGLEVQCFLEDRVVLEVLFLPKCVITTINVMVL
jgi:hypothetical protein